MTPRSFEYFTPKTLKEAINLLSTKEDSKVMAGGQSLLALMKLRLASPAYIIDINPLQELSYIKPRKDRSLAIGALTTHDMIENSALIKKNSYLLSEAASRIGDQQIRNRGTIGGSLCHADPAADTPTAILALDTEMVAQGKKDERIIKAKDFFVDLFTTNLKPNEVLTEIRIPALQPNTGTAYMKLSRRAGDFAIVGAAAVISKGKDGVCTKASVALGAVGPTPLRAVGVEKALVGKKLTSEAIEKAAEKAPEGIDPPSDIHGSAEYRTAMTKVMAKRVVTLALSRTKR